MTIVVVLLIFFGVLALSALGTGMIARHVEDNRCSWCDGRGVRRGATCQICDGSGMRPGSMDDEL